MSNQDKNNKEAVSRRDLLAAGGGLAAMAAGGAAQASGHGSLEDTRFRMTNTKFMQIPKDPRLDLDDPETNYMAMLKMRADLAEKDCLFAFPGEAWVMVPQEKNHRCFKTFGIGASRIEEVEEGWRIYSREVLYYMDPDTGEILETWNNPFLGGREVEVHHIANDPVNGVFARQGNPILSPPYPYVSHGDDVVFQWNFFHLQARAADALGIPAVFERRCRHACRTVGPQGTQERTARSVDHIGIVRHVMEPRRRLAAVHGDGPASGHDGVPQPQHEAHERPRRPAALCARLHGKELSEVSRGAERMARPSHDVISRRVQEEDRRKAGETVAGSVQAGRV